MPAGEPSLHGLGQRMMCSGWAHFQRRSRRGCASRFVRPVRRVVFSTSSRLRPDSFAVMVVLVVLGYIEVDGAFAFVGISVFSIFSFYQFYLFDDMSAGMRFDAGRQHIQCIPCLVVAVDVCTVPLPSVPVVPDVPSWQSCLLRSSASCSRWPTSVILRT